MQTTFLLTADLNPRTRPVYISPPYPSPTVLIPIRGLQAPNLSQHLSSRLALHDQDVVVQENLERERALLGETSVARTSPKGSSLLVFLAESPPHRLRLVGGKVSQGSSDLLPFSLALCGDDRCHHRSSRGGVALCELGRGSFLTLVNWVLLSCLVPFFSLGMSISA